MNAVVTQLAAAPRSVVEERAMRPPTIGRVRPGIKALTSAARSNERAVIMYNEMVAAGDSFDTIAKAIESKCRIKNALAPRNVPYFTCRRSDFANPDVADEILRLYGEDRGDGLKLYRFPVLFAFNDWMNNLPNQMAAWGTTGRKFFSEYGPDGMRYCKTYAKAEPQARAQRAVRHFGGRTVIFRQDDAIPDGICDPEQCPQYQSRQCNLTAHFVFAIPEIKGLGLIELPTNSIYVLQKAYASMQTVLLARGKLTGTRFWISKREFDITRINEAGEAVRTKQMLTVLDADIDIGALLDGAEDSTPAIQAASDAVALLEAGGNVHPLHGAGLVQIDEGDTQGPIGGARQDASVGLSPTDAGGSGAAQRDSGASDDGGPPMRDPTETIEDKRHRMQDLLQRLGFSADDRKQDFRIYAHVKYGRGWSERAQDVDRMNTRLVEALKDCAALDREVSEARRVALTE